MYLSVIVPCYNEEDNVKLFYDTITNVFGDLMNKTELIFINDGSKDNTYQELIKIVENSPYNVKAIQFSRNFGKEAALLAGLKESKGEYVSIIDADLQQRPEYILKMVSILDEHSEYDCVAAYQDVRKEGKFLTFFKDCFYKLINKLTEVEFVKSASDFRTLRRNMVDAIISLPERCRFSKGIFSWVGFETCFIPYTVEDRLNGESKWSFWKLFSYAIDGIIAFSTLPLVISSILGIILCVIALLCMLVIVVKTLIWGDPVAGYPTLASLLLLTAGVQLFFIGVLGQYLAKNYTEAKQRPLYIVKEMRKS